MKRISLGRKDIKVEVKGEPIRINIVEDKFQVAVDNILENSLRYAKTRLTIDLHRKFINPAVGEVTEISIYNDGIPIEEAIINNLFSKFHKGKNGNFGLGLYISNKIIKFHRRNILAGISVSNIICINNIILIRNGNFFLKSLCKIGRASCRERV